MQCNKRLKYTAAHIICSVLNEKSLSAPQITDDSRTHHSVN